ncbi:Apyrase [Frankliniella fusca]|uniref:apyrase n=1 Tax=Frankliniella fusca TaxID=407009 RepID=A0AAE1I118_9NEOP|nr:Apyrase [Frankliniella fusca]
MSVVHLNDFHARFEPVSPEFTSCDPSLVNTCVPYPCRRDAKNCVGGIARVAAAMERLRRQHPDSLVLNAGDNFQGSLYYYVHRHAIMSFFLNRLRFDAMALGNHEFDQGVENVKAFLRRLSFPALAANMNASADPQLAELVKPSIVVTRGGRRIGVIGYMLNNTHDISNTGGTRWSGELEAVDREAARLKDSGVHIIVCVSHDGLAGDLHVARHSKHVDLIVGGHSHTLLYSGTPPTDDRVFGDYPVVAVQQPERGRQVLVVQAMAASKYLGHILVTFDADGEVVGWEGRPLLLDQSVPQDARTQMMLRAWRPAVALRGQRLVGHLGERLSQDDFECLTGECNIGNAVADAFVDHWRKQPGAPPVTVGAVVGWSMVANLEKGGKNGLEYRKEKEKEKKKATLSYTGGPERTLPRPLNKDPPCLPADVTFEDVFNVLPYEYTVDLFRVRGADLLGVLESSAAGEGLFQWSGLTVVLDLSRPPGQRVLGARVRTDLAQSLDQYPALDPAAEYVVTTQSVALGGGYSNPKLKSTHRDRIRGPPDHEVLAAFLGEHWDLAQGMEGRVTMVGGRAHPRRYSGLSNNIPD